jgi:L-lactate dehydrogenase (cytochrome)
VSFPALLSRQLRGDLASAGERLRRPRVERCGSVAELRALARRRVPRAVFDYVEGAAGDELTAGANQADLRRLELLPRVLAGADAVELGTTVLGQPVDVPILGAPTGLTGLVHHRGEAALARAVNAAGSIYVLSAVGSYSIEEIARAGAGPKWFQLYVWRDRGLVRSMLERAREAGYGVLVVTVDVPRAGARERDRRNGFTVPPRVTLRSFGEGLLRPRWSADFIRRPRILPESATRTGASQGDPVSLTTLINTQFDPTLTWDDVAWLQAEWDGPIVLKGVLRAQDARRAADVGLAGVIVSNHGGRQLDQAVSSILALEAVVDAAGADLEVLFDGGIRRGVDVVKALALGARACLAGRALVYGLAAGGDAGAARAMTLLTEELRLALTLAGCASVHDLDRSWISTRRD